MFSRFFTFLFLAQHILLLYPSEVKAETTCQAGYEWNAQRNDCVLTQDSQRELGELKRCEKFTDEKEKQKCLLENAANDSSYVSQERTADKLKWDKAFDLAYKTSILLVPMIIHHGEKRQTCEPKSWLVFYTGAAAVGAGEIYNYFFEYKPKIKQLHEKYKSLVNWGENATSSQKSAFNYLAEEQEILKKVASNKEYIYLTASGLYTISAAWTAIEMIKKKSNYISAGSSAAKTAACNASNENAQKVVNFLKRPLFKFLSIATGVIPWNYKNTFNFKDTDDPNSVESLFMKTSSLPSFDLEKIKRIVANPFKEVLVAEEKISFIFEERTHSLPYDIQIEAENLMQHFKNASSNSLTLLKEEFLIPNANAEGDMYKSAVSNQTESTLAPSDKLAKQAKTQDWMRLATAATMAGFSLTISRRAHNASLAHKHRAEAMRTAASTFPNSSDEDLGICTDADRSDPSKKTCYCFIQENGVDKPNPERIKSEVCAKLFNTKLNLNSSDYELGKGSTGKICVDKMGNIDQQCRCKQQKDKSGQNNCMKIPAGGAYNGTIMFNTAGLNFTPGLNENLGNGITGGTYGGDYTSTIDQALGLVKKQADALLKNEGKKDSFANLEKSLQKEMQKMAQSFQMPNSPVPGISTTGTTLASVVSPKNMEAIEKKAEELGIKSSELKNVIDSTQKASNEKNSLFDLGSANESGTEELSMQGDVMAKNFNYGANDISKQQDENLFKVISNRYLQSGFKRLFEEIPKEESVTKPVDK